MALNCQNEKLKFQVSMHFIRLLVASRSRKTINESLKMHLVPFDLLSFLNIMLHR